MQESMSVLDYLQMSKDVSQNLLEKSKNLSWYDLNISADQEIVKIRRKVGEIRSEIHRMRGFVRFNSLNENILFGYMKPKNNIGRLITDIFAKRFQENVIILGNEKKVWISYYSKNIYHRHEESRNLSEIVEEVKTLINNYQEIETNKIWEVYYNSQYIKERENHKLFYKNMPRKHLKSAGNDIELRLNSSTLDEYI
ncbi:MAG: hypothetical protein AMQ74_00083 [Candidatus Methanofastidiosum methylothiophilum]|uniref:DUF4130 domain-containing protein n=1 Tax=Candidatus Methanofastidiosum methylothiophilum TaxID=1705564 RepID=A0A150JAT3_9EURY|nr:MAG: hypothetical protein AMQ74_00083 [Candidatus Methanofastidiosum methylthiophilus]